MKTRTALLATFVLLLFLGGVYIWAFNRHENSSKSVDSFEECLNAGSPIMESFPRQCRTEDGRLFVEQLDNLPVPVQPAAESNLGGVCKNLCGDGVCQEMVCQAVGCPCSESVESCPADCRKEIESVKNNTELKRYQNGELGVEFEYPTDWKFDERLLKNFAPEFLVGQNRVLLQVGFFDNPGQLSVKDWVEKKNFFKLQNYEKDPTVYQAYGISEEIGLILNGTLEIVVYRGVGSGGAGFGTAIVPFQKSKVLVIAYSDSEAGRVKTFETFQGIVQSVKLK